MTPGTSRRRWMWSAVLGMGISAVFLYLTLRRVDLAGVRGALGGVSLPILSLALVTRGSAFLAMGLRSRATVAPGGDVAYKSLTLSHLLGYTGNNVLPFRLGELLRVDYLARRGKLSRSFLMGTVAVERLLDSVVLLALFALTVPLVVGESLLEGSYPFLVAATVLAMGLGVLVVRWRGFPAFLGRAVQLVSSRWATTIQDHAGRVVTGLTSLASARWAPAALGATLLYWLCAVGSIRVAMAAFGLTLPWYAPFLVLAVTSLGTALPSSPSFVGTYHYFSALGLSLLGAEASTSASFAIVAHAMAFIPYTVLGLLVFARSIRVWLGQDASP
ncbi:lysylphosphatidylglycerol synthase transmembrane domain-containing protein [Gemmatimonadota bacterium]